jgi:hypothetical protein
MSGSSGLNGLSSASGLNGSGGINIVDNSTDGLVTGVCSINANARVLTVAEGPYSTDLWTIYKDTGYKYSADGTFTCPVGAIFNKDASHISCGKQTQCNKTEDKCQIDKLSKYTCQWNVQ